ncbi:MAG: HAMP domain-containing protein [Peptococcaceae bacterium]|nr:HAMP domain-containing protein [Peptococcaceae bacterium]
MKLRFGIMSKFLAGFGVVLVLMVLTSFYLVNNMKSIDRHYALLIDKKANAYALTGMALNSYSQALGNLNAFIIGGNPSNEVQYYKAVEAGDGLLDKIASLIEDEEEAKFFDFFKKKTAEFKDVAQQIIPLVRARENATGDERLAAEASLSQFLSGADLSSVDPTRSGETFAYILAQNLDKHKNLNNSKVQQVIKSSMILVAALVVVGIVIIYFVARKVTLPIALVDAGAARIASGDLSGTQIGVKSRDESGRLADSFNTMHKNLKEMVAHLQEKSRTVAESAAGLSENAENVTAGITETTSTISQIAAVAEQVADRAQRISEAAVRAAGHAEEGNEGLKKISSQITIINNTVAESRDTIHGLNDSSVKISQIVELITGIADQTNLLALNAAIEAARAGDQGRGFAVVAEEVRKLAEQSSEASKEIQGLINTIQQESGKAVMSMDQSSSQAEKGTSIVKEVEEVFKSISEAARNLVEEIQSIAAASGEISESVQNLAATAQEQNATMEEVSSTTQAMAALADELETLAGRFRL